MLSRRASLAPEKQIGRDANVYTIDSAVNSQRRTARTIHHALPAMTL